MENNIIYNRRDAMDDEGDYCDLDPTKLCDSCCKCLDDAESGNFRSLNLAEFMQKQERKVSGIRKRRNAEKNPNA